jgi:membrane protein implicated in regulation of membrane protease activity
VLANLAWIDELDVEGWVIVTAGVVGLGVALYVLAGPLWLVVAASLYLALLVAVKLATSQRRRRSTSSS